VSAVPESTLPGHRLLHERVTAALGVCQEARAVEFKGSAPWRDLQFHIVRTGIAMANLRDGGIIIVGVSERSGSWHAEGILADHLETYDEDELNDLFTKHASPPVRLELVIVRHGSVPFLTIRVPEFDLTPVLCQREGPQSARLRKGAIYVRTLGKPQTMPAEDASHLHELLELAAEKRARRILETASRIGLTLPDSTRQAFDRELGGL